MELFFIILGIAFIICVGIVIYQEIHSTSRKPKAPKTPCPPKRIDGMKFTRLTIKSIIRWEQIRGKSFVAMDYSGKEDIEALLYTMHICEAEPDYPFEVFRQVLVNEKFLSGMASELNRVMSIVSQFQKKRETSDVGGGGGSQETIGSIISTLIMAGLDAHYALNEMELCDLSLYIEAYERKRKEDMESSRLWTYFAMLPHIDAKKMKNGARDLITFPWEEAEKEITDEETNRFEAFMKMGKDFINN